MNEPTLYPYCRKCSGENLTTNTVCPTCYNHSKAMDVVKAYGVPELEGRRIKYTDMLHDEEWPDNKDLPAYLFGVEFHKKDQFDQCREIIDIIRRETAQRKAIVDAQLADVDTVMKECVEGVVRESGGQVSDKWQAFVNSSE